jgi:hypothetical protein
VCLRARRVVFYALAGPRRVRRRDTTSKPSSPPAMSATEAGSGAVVTGNVFGLAVTLTSSRKL